MSHYTPGCTNYFLEYLLIELDLKNDAALARALEVAPPVISKMRHGTLQLGPSLILFIHEKYGFTVSLIRELSGARPRPGVAA